MNTGYGSTLRPSPATQQISPSKTKNSSKPHASSTAGGSPWSFSATTSPSLRSSALCAWASAGRSTHSRRSAKPTVTSWRGGWATRSLELNCLYRWHATSETDEHWIGKVWKMFFERKDFKNVTRESLRWQRRRRRRWSRIVNIGRLAGAYSSL